MSYHSRSEFMVDSKKINNQYVTVEMPELDGLKWVIKLLSFAWLPIVLSIIGSWVVSALWILSSSLLAFALIQMGESNQSGIALPESIIGWLSQHESPVLLCFWLIITTIIVLGIIETFLSWIYTWIHLIINKKISPQVIEASITSSPDCKLDASTAVQRWLLKADLAHFIEDVFAAPLGHIGCIVIAVFATYQANIVAGHISIICLFIWVLVAIPLTVRALKASKRAAQSHEIVGRTIRSGIALRLDLSRPSLSNFWLKKNSPSVQHLQQAIAEQGLWNVILLGSLSIIASVTPYIAVIATISAGSIASSIAILLYLIRISGPLSALSRLLLWNQQSIISVQRLFNMIVKQFHPIDNGAKQFDSVSTLEILNWVVRVTDNTTIAFPDNVASNESILCIVGPSGSGKSTLLKSLASLMDIETGELRLDGKIVDIKDSNWRETCGFLPQEPELIPGTIKDNLMGFADWCTNEFIMNAIDRVLYAVEGAEDCIVDIDNKGVSVGQRRCIALLRCLGCSSGIILLDEPIAGIDDSLVDGLRDAIEDAQRQGRILILTAHEHDFERLKLEKSKIVRINPFLGNVDMKGVIV